MTDIIKDIVNAIQVVVSSHRARALHRRVSSTTIFRSPGYSETHRKAMYLRRASLRYSNVIAPALCPSTCLIASPSVPRTIYHGSHRTLTLSRRHQEGGQRRHDHHGQRIRSSIRPFTVLLLCVPIGFAVSWALGDDKKGRNSASPDGFLKYRLKEKEAVSSTSSIFTLEPATTSAIETTDPILRRAVKSVQIKQPQLQIARNYTLLPTAHEDGDLKFLIRRELNGEVSGYLHRLPIGSDVELRGPVVDLVLPPDVRSVVFLAGGTGIVPAMQVAKALGGKANVHILWASRRREECVGGVSDTPQAQGWIASLRGWFVADGKTHIDERRGVSELQKNQMVLELEHLMDSSRKARLEDVALTTDYFVDEEGTFISPNQVQRLLQEDDLSSSVRLARKLVLISGPDGFVKHWAGAKEWVDGREVQGRLGGVLSLLNTAGWDIVKL